MKKVSIYLMLAMLIFAAFSYAPAANAITIVDSGPEWTKCADENGKCTFEGYKEVRFGADGSYYSKIALNGTDCISSEFQGDPAEGMPKQCEIRDVPLSESLNVGTVVGRDSKTITIYFDRDVTPVDAATLKDEVTAKKTIGENDTNLGIESVAYEAASPRKIVLTMSEVLVGEGYSVSIAAAALVLEGETEPYATPIELSGIVGIDITPPAFVGAESYNNDVVLHFNEQVKPMLPGTVDAEDNAAVEAYLLSQIQIAQDGEHFSPLVSGVAHLYRGSDVWDIRYDDGFQVVTGPKTRVKLAAGVLQDTAGNVVLGEMNLSVSPPVIEGASVSSDYKTITVTFDRNVYAIGSLGQLKSGISMIDDRTSYNGLGDGDSVELEGKTLIITLEKPLTGEQNQVYIEGNTLRDADGNYMGSSNGVTTPFLQGGPGGETTDTTAPEVTGYYYSDELRSVTFQFNEDVTIPDEDMAAFRNGVKLFNPYNWSSWSGALPSDATVKVEGSKITLHLTSLTNFSTLGWLINTSFVQDLKGNHQDGEYNTDWFNWSRVRPLTLSDASFQRGGRTLQLNMNGYNGASWYDDLVDLTADGDGSHLKDNITISRDNGATFVPLSAEDKIYLNQTNIDILLHEPIVSITVQIKIKSGVLTDEHHMSVNAEIMKTVASNETVLSGYLFSDTDSELNFSGSVAWLQHVGSVVVWDWSTEAYRVLNTSEYQIGDGTLTVKKGVFVKGRRYEVGIQAEGYRYTYLVGSARLSSDIFFITAPAITKSGGITAKVFIYNNQVTNDGPSLNSQSNSAAAAQVVVFELFNGTTPVSIASAELAVGTGTYSAKFNVSDEDLSNYTVKAFVVSRFDAATDSIGLSLGTVKTQTEIDEAMILSQYNNNDN